MGLSAALLHPLTESGALPVSPVFLAVLTALLVAVAAIPAGRRTAPSPAPDSYLAEPLSGGRVAGRVLVVALLVLAVVAGRAGTNRIAENIAPALVVGVGWPLLVLLAGFVGDVWARVDPWDGLARGLERARVAAPDRAVVPAAGVRAAVPVAVVIAWYLAAYRDALQPRAVSMAVALYTLVTLVGCLALGRRTWLSRAEPVGLFLGWLGMLPRRRLGGWAPPRGAAALLGVLGGGLLFGAVRLSEAWSRFAFPHYGLVVDSLGFVACASAGALILMWLARHERRLSGQGAVVAAAVPVVGAIALALAMVGGRLVNAAQLLVPLVSDPLGFGWDLFGTAGWPVRPYPLTPGVHLLIQLGVLVAGGCVGARIARGRAARVPDGDGAHLPAVVGAALLVAVAALAVSVL